MSDGYFDLMLSFVERAGKIALKHFGKNKPRFKKDHSVVTAADHAVSALAKQYLRPLIKTGQHLLIDEENPRTKDFLSTDFLKKYPNIWAVDPIDGTRLYANRMPLFGISIGLIKNLKPCLGAVYLPALRELYYCDGQKAYFVSQAFTSKQKKITIKKVDQKITGQSVLLCDDAVLKDYSWDYKDCQLMIPTCAVVDLCWPTVNRACGAVFKSYIWDFAGSWPIFLKAGLDLRSLSSGKSLNFLDTNAFKKDKTPWKVKDFYVLSSKRNYSVIRKKFKKR